MSQKKRSNRFLYFPLALIFLTLFGFVWVMTSHGTAPTQEQLADKPHRLTVLTWNTERLGQYQKPAKNEVLLYLMEQDADIICLQEVDVYKNDRYLTLPEVKRVLGKKYPYSYLDFSVYDKRHQFGTMVWSKYPLLHKQSISYESKGNLSNRCDIVIEKDTIRLINNHLESYSFTQDDLTESEGLRSSARKLEEKWERALPLRNAQARMVRSEIVSSPYPVIVVGDFNSVPLSYTYFCLSRGLHDAWAKTSWFRWGTTCEKRHIGLRIDYILSSKQLVPIRCEIPQASGSDHWPVVATLAW